MIQMKLRTLIAKLEKVDQQKPLRFENTHTEGKGYKDIPEADKYNIDPHRAGVGKFHSWRGNYVEFAIEPTEEVRTVADTLQELKNALGKTFEGYKGGEFTATGYSPIYCAQYGRSSAWTRTGEIYEFLDGTTQTLSVHLKLTDVIERENEVVILYDEDGEY